MGDNAFLQRSFLIVLAAFLSIAILGCQDEWKSSPNADKVFKAYKPHQTLSPDYVIDPPDQVTIKAPNIKELDKVTATVRPDGKVAFNLLGEVSIAGLTPQQACEQLKALTIKYYNSPDITIDVAARSKFYEVWGRGAAKPALKPCTGNDYIVKAIAEAGFDYTTYWPEQIALVRPAKGDVPATRAVIDFTKIEEEGLMHQNYVIEEGDSLVIRDSPLSHLNLKLQQVFGPLLGAGQAVNSGENVVHPAP